MLHSWNKMLHKNNIQTAKIILWNENHGSMKNSTESLEDPIKEIFQKVEKKEQELENKREGPLLHQSSPVSFFLFILSFLLSLFQANSLERGGPLSPLSCPGFWDPLEKAPTREGARCLRAAVRALRTGLYGFPRKPGDSSLFLSLTLRTTRFRSSKGPTDELLCFLRPHS